MVANPMPFHVLRRDHLRSTSGIICGSGSFAVQFGDHDHLRSGIICGAVHDSTLHNVFFFSHFYNLSNGNKERKKSLISPAKIKNEKIGIKRRFRL